MQIACDQKGFTGAKGQLSSTKQKVRAMHFHFELPRIGWISEKNMNCNSWSGYWQIHAGQIIFENVIALFYSLLRHAYILLRKAQASCAKQIQLYFRLGQEITILFKTYQGSRPFTAC